MKLQVTWAAIVHLLLIMKQISKKTYFRMNFRRDWILNRFQVNPNIGQDGQMNQFDRPAAESMYLQIAHLD